MYVVEVCVRGDARGRQAEVLGPVRVEDTSVETGIRMILLETRMDFGDES